MGGAGSGGLAGQGAGGSFGGMAGSAGAPGGTGGTGTGGSGTGGTTNTSPLVDPACTDGKYTEALPNPTADLSGVAFSPTGLDAYFLGVLGLRYPIGKDVVAGGLTNKQFGKSCIQMFAGNPTSAAQAQNSIGTVVHECGHLYDMVLAKLPSNSYFIRSGMQPTCQKGDTVARGGDTFARSLITKDTYSALRPPCTGSPSAGCDSYASVYLDGDPNNASFEGGDQGYNMLLEETVQYVNSLATGWAFVDHLKSGQKVSERDGILTFLWYVERYLKMARTQYPNAYKRIADDACWRDITLNVWGRAWLFLEQTKGIGSLSINGAAIETLVKDPALLNEIELLRTKSGCP